MSAARTFQTHATGTQATRNGALLRLDRVSRHFGKLQAVQDVSFAMNEGELRAVIGPLRR